ncbi:hypothetical protein [Pseudalkalibacillus decolorationis]|uniref:hypothetical protein n=1 Tax=Pseudalkalibacillus decolorationis TaxID=163879 RepID=UPI0021495655|nr:hypothetical protein [Pseudalkalibacillus decolorationis]
MTSVTLDYQQVLLFTGLSESTVEAKGQKALVDKLKAMGVENVNKEGRGKKTVYRLMIPSYFWTILMIPTKHSAVSVDIMKLLIDGNVQYIDGQALHLFIKEMLTVISLKHQVKYATVEKAYNRIKRYLVKHDLLSTSENKSHRIMRDGKWIDGKRAIEISNQIKSLWRRMFERLKVNNVTDRKKIQAECNWQRDFIIRAHNADAYKVTKLWTPNPNLIRDIRWAEAAFYAGANLVQIKREIEDRHSKYEVDKKNADELLKRLDENIEVDVETEVDTFILDSISLFTQDSDPSSLFLN